MQSWCLMNEHLLSTTWGLGGLLLQQSNVFSISVTVKFKKKNCEVITLHGLCEPMLVKAARDRQFEQCQMSRRVVWPCVIAVLYWAVCLSCQTRSSFLADAARSFMPGINLWASMSLRRAVGVLHWSSPVFCLRLHHCPSDEHKNYKRV